MASEPADNSDQVFRWVLDVQSQWPCSDSIRSSREAATHWARENDNQRALEFLTAEEREKVLRFYHIRDVKLSLGSQLLKRCAVVRSCHVPWSESVISKHENHKPCYVPKDGSGKHLEFNVSHHGSLVVLAGCTDKTVQLGIDVMQIDTVKDLARVRQEGWPSWVKTYADVFSDREVRDIVNWVPPSAPDANELIKASIRHFYAHWCLKEAYVKMTGEALMAPWLQDMEFRNVEAPRPASGLTATDSPPTASSLTVKDSANDWGETISTVEAWRGGKRISGLKLEVQAFRDDYLIALASSRLDIPLSPYKLLDLQQDVYSAAEANGPF
ncbi:MAG: hypothetical protein Q9168_007426 [Polycauliona sp. 1 TL-2023]